MIWQMSFHHSSEVVKSYRFHSRGAAAFGSWMRTVQTEVNCRVMGILSTDALIALDLAVSGERRGDADMNDE